MLKGDLRQDKCRWAQLRLVRQDAPLRIEPVGRWGETTV